MKPDEQPSLFSAAELAGCYRVKQVDPLQLSQGDLQAWKQRVFHHQQQVKVSSPPQQTTLFDLEPPVSYIDAETINPFVLPQQNIDFWRWKAEDQGVAALYFVIDYDLPILLYVGETVKSNQRWKGEHDCKRYLRNYRQAHYQTGLNSMLGIAFWSHAPAETRWRQQLELALINRWRSPFNKENWTFWGTPFIGEKLP